MKQWSSLVGQPHPPNAAFPTPHTLAQVSLSVTPDGSKALYNSIEGLTSLWNLENGEVIGTFESFTKKTDESEPCKLALQNVPEKTAHRLFSFQAWGVSIHPSGETYASTGASGNVLIHSAKPESFGERRTTLSSGRPKFGMTCTYVCNSFSAFCSPCNR